MILEVNTNPFKVEPGRLPKPWQFSIRKRVPLELWNLIREIAIKSNTGDCAVCKGLGKRKKLTFCEYWTFDEKNKIQTLSKLLPTCQDCYSVRNLNAWSLKGVTFENGIKHLKKVNKWTKKEALEHFYMSIDKLEDRREEHRKWKVQIGDYFIS
tara:strand:+ start:13820 stop:14281 length:462 start_codon:yes stop_codon:yes gene_type:complete